MRLLLVDDHSLFRAGLRMLLAEKSRFSDIVEAPSLTAALAEARATTPDIVLLDLNLPDSHGFDGIPALRDAGVTGPILIVTGEDSQQSIHGAFEAGAQGYLPKTSSGSAFVAAIETVLSGEYYVPAQAVPCLSSRPPAPPSDMPPAPEASGEVHLTPRQRQVLRLVARGLANKEIAVELDMSPSTVRVHVTAILRALAVENRTQAATHPETHRLLAAH